MSLGVALRSVVAALRVVRVHLDAFGGLVALCGPVPALASALLVQLSVAAIMLDRQALAVVCVLFRAHQPCLALDWAFVLLATALLVSAELLPVATTATTATTAAATAAAATTDATAAGGALLDTLAMGARRLDAVGPRVWGLDAAVHVIVTLTVLHCIAEKAVMSKVSWACLQYGHGMADLRLRHDRYADRCGIYNTWARRCQTEHVLHAPGQHF